MLKDKDIEFLSEVSGKWRSVGRPYSQQCLKTLSEYKLRHKPKIVVINGVEVVAPVELPVGTKVWYPSVVCKRLQKGSVGGGLSIYWLKEEDAQKALDAMLIPFKQ